MTTPIRRFGTIKFKPNPIEETTSESFNFFLKNTTTPSLVLRVPDVQNFASEEESFALSPIYNSIEKEFIKNGFTVRDRGLFNEVLSKSSHENYSAIQSLTNTDIILEVLDINWNVEYHTNKYLNKNGKERKISGDIMMNGCAVIFKLIIVQSNDVAGIYKFNYAPCENGCEYYIDDTGRFYPKPNSSKSVKPYEFVKSDNIESFISIYTQDLIQQLKK
ncbi:MAG: hypothetical protein ACJAYJ_004898 [Saprospiraceae bacterium]|jgi:hypothetical protein